MDFVTVWKTVSVALTGLFGILGLLTNYKDKDTGKVTKWGYCSLAGIVVSTTMGIAAQLKETSTKDESQRKATAQTLSLVQNTSQSVTQISRLLQSLDRPSVYLSIDIDCTLESYKRFCADVTAKAEPRARNAGSSIVSFSVPDVDWSLFPSSILPIHASFFRSAAKAEEFIKSGCRGCSAGDLHMNVFGEPDRLKTLGANFETSERKVSIAIFLKETTPQVITRELMAVPDFAGSTVVLHDPNKALDSLAPTHLGIGTARGQEVTYSRLSPRQTSTGRVFVATAPNDL